MRGVRRPVVAWYARVQQPAAVVLRRMRRHPSYMRCVQDHQLEIQKNFAPLRAGRDCHGLDPQAASQNFCALASLALDGSGSTQRRSKRSLFLKKSSAKNFFCARHLRGHTVATQQQGGIKSFLRSFFLKKRPLA
jgi:hypothetical protein